MPRANPFKPSFGVSPPLLVGRDALREDFLDAVADGPGAQGRATIYTGARGSGKTVMLNAIQDDARERGWIVIAETALPGLVGRLTTEHLPALLARHDEDADGSGRLTGVTLPAGLGGASWQPSDTAPTAGLRPQLTQLCGVLARQGTGLLITVDELHRRPLDELTELCTVIQHAFREELELAFAGAGLASAVHELLSEDVVTFLRRAERHHLGRVAEAEVARALRTPIENAGRRIDNTALKVAVAATGGYPFLIQLVGSRTWREHPDTSEISTDDARNGAEAARRRLGTLVHEVSLADCSDIDKTFLLAMAHDDGPSKVSDLRSRLNVDAGYIGVYRQRLIAAELIEPVGHGRVDFALPYLREYLREHVAIGGI